LAAREPDAILINVAPLRRDEIGQRSSACHDGDVVYLDGLDQAATVEVKLRLVLGPGRHPNRGLNPRQQQPSGHARTGRHRRAGLDPHRRQWPGPEVQGAPTPATAWCQTHRSMTHRTHQPSCRYRHAAGSAAG
jgi:hypothetical protein